MAASMAGGVVWFMQRHGREREHAVRERGEKDEEGRGRGAGPAAGGLRRDRPATRDSRSSSPLGSSGAGRKKRIGQEAAAAGCLRLLWFDAPQTWEARRGWIGRWRKKRRRRSRGGSRPGGGGGMGLMGQLP